VKFRIALITETFLELNIFSYITLFILILQIISNCADNVTENCVRKKIRK
jgi:hypothetical protein